MSYLSLNDIVAPTSVQWGLQFNTFSSTSFANVTQAVSHPGAIWKGQMNFELTSDTERVDLEIFLEELEGSAGRFKVFNPVYETYPAQGTPIVGQSNQSGKSLYTSGWLPNRRVLRKGQCFTINHELKRASEDVYSDAHGVTTLKFNPRLRVIPKVSTPIEVSEPYMLATLNSDYNPVDFDAQLNGTITLEFTEAIYERV